MAESTNGSRARVLYLTWRDRDHPEAGGAEVFAERTATELVLLGHDVTMFSSSFNGAARQVDRDGFTILRRGRRYSVYLRAIVFMLVHGRRFDTVIDVQNGVPFWAPLVFRGRVVNLTHHVHREQWSTFFPWPVSAFGWFLESKIAVRVYRNAHYVTVSESSKADLMELGVSPERISIIYSGIDVPEDFENLRALERTPEPSLVVVGRLVPHKRVEIAVDSLAKHAASLPDLQLHVVGDGYWLDNIRAHAEARQVSDRVHMHGFVDGNEKHRLLATSWIMALPSLKEGWGLTIIEAALHSTPAIAFRDAGGTQESIVDNNTGVLADDVDGFHEAVLRLATDEDYRKKLGDNARMHALTFDWKRSAAELSELLDGHQPGVKISRRS